jgi:hypothetical protein
MLRAILVNLLAAPPPGISPSISIPAFNPRFLRASHPETESSAISAYKLARELPAPAIPDAAVPYTGTNEASAAVISAIAPEKRAISTDDHSLFG